LIGGPLSWTFLNAQGRCERSGQVASRYGTQIPLKGFLIDDIVTRD